jgi:predicted permease
METIWQDLRYAVRILVKNPGFAVVSVITLALGIGANTAIFSVVKGVLVQALPYSHAERLVGIFTASPERGLKGFPVSFTKMTRIRERSHTLEQVGAYLPVLSSLQTRDLPVELSAVKVTANFFDVLGTAPVLGRSFLSEEDRPGGADVVMVSHRFWLTRLGGDPNAIGRTLPLDGRSVTLIGVLPGSFHFPFLEPEPDVWFPRAFENPGLNPVQVYSGASYLFLQGRIREGSSLAAVQSELNAINADYEREFPGFADSKQYVLEVDPLKESLVGPLRMSLLVLFAAVGFVLMIACANEASLLLARATVRAREMAIRSALGGSQTRLARQLLTESLLLSFVAGGLGIALTVATLRALRSLPQGTLPRIDEIGVDPLVLGFCLLLSLITGLVFGLLPSVQASRKAVQESLKEEVRGSSGSRRSGRSLALLVSGEVAIVALLLSGAGILLKSFSNLAHIDPGFDANHVTTFTITLPEARYGKPAQKSQFFRRLVDSIETLPQVRAAAVVNFIPLSGTRFVYFCPEGTVCQGIGKDPIIALRQITPDYFKTMGIPLLRGRLFNDGDREDGHPVAIINQWTAEHYYAGKDPIGRQIANSRDMIQREIVGVVGDVRFVGVNTPASQEMYLPQAQNPFGTMTLVIRSDAAVGSLANTVTRKVADLDAELPVSNIITMNDVVATSIAQPRLTAQFVSGFASAALLLTIVGIYGVIAYAVTRRTREIGVRLAVGCPPGRILLLVLNQGMQMVLLGLVVGTIASLFLTHLLSSLLFGTSPRDPFILTAVPCLVVVIALVACYVPAHRAAHIDPLVALRSD